jgi:hypothetical protein
MPVCLAQERGPSPGDRRRRLSALSSVLVAVACGLAGCDTPGFVLILDSRPTVQALDRLRVRVTSPQGEVSQEIAVGGRRIPLSIEFLTAGRTGPFELSIVGLAISPVARSRDAEAAGIPVAVADVTIPAQDLANTATIRLVLEPADFVVSSTTDGVQRASFESSSGRNVAAAPDGTFLIVFESDNAVAGRLFGPDARPIENTATASDSEFSISESFGCCRHFNPAVGHSSAGFLVTWENEDTELSPPEPLRYYFAAAYADQTAAPKGNTLISNQGANRWGSVAGLANGDFALAWMRSPDPQTYQGNVTARTIDSGGQPTGNDIQVELTPGNIAGTNHIAGLEDDGFVVVWERSDDGGLTHSVKARLFSSTGAPRAGEIDVAAPAPRTARLPQVVAMPGGGFAVAWVEFPPVSGTTEKQEIMLRTFDAAGRGGPARPAAELSGTIMYIPALAVRPRDGAIALAWADGPGQPEETYDVYLQLFDTNGEAIAERMQVNTTTDRGQYLTSIAARPADDSFVVVWNDQSQALPDDNGTAVRARIVYSQGQSTALPAN